MRRSVPAGIAATVLLLTVTSAARAQASCDPLSTGAIAPPTSVSTVEVVAPVGQLIDEVCMITEGSTVPERVMVDPLVPSLVLDGEGSAIVEYSASFVIAVDSDAEEADVAIPPQPATVPLDDHEMPSAADAGGGGTEVRPGAGPTALLGLAFMSFAAAAAQFATAHRRRRR